MDKLESMILNENTNKIKAWQSYYWKKFNLQNYNSLHISEEIHGKDLMLPKNSNLDGYKITGMATEECIRLGKNLINLKFDHSTNILVLPSGYGREYRYLIKVFPECNLFACDVEVPAVDFCVEKFGGTGIYSQDDVNDLDLHPQFDVIWVGSLFSHLNLEKWHDFFNLFCRSLKENGIVIITTEGQIVKKMIEFGDYQGISAEKAGNLLLDYENNGFAHVGYDSEIPTHATPDLKNYYGRTLVKPEFVFHFIKNYQALRSICYLPDYWCARQDVYFFQKNSLYQQI